MYLPPNWRLPLAACAAKSCGRATQGEIILYAPGGYGGYFLPSNDPETAQKEMAAFYHVQVARCKHGLKSVAPVARKLGIPLGQLNFESEGM